VKDLKWVKWEERQPVVAPPAGPEHADTRELVAA